MATSTVSSSLKIALDGLLGEREGVDVREFIDQRRPASWLAISAELRDATGVLVNPTTLMRWWQASS